jgi:hypothetical protein
MVGDTEQSGVTGPQRQRHDLIRVDSTLAGVRPRWLPALLTGPRALKRTAAKFGKVHRVSISTVIRAEKRSRRDPAGVENFCRNRTLLAGSRDAISGHE